VGIVVRKVISYSEVIANIRLKINKTANGQSGTEFF
jgi:hypothetical protein